MALPKPIALNGRSLQRPITGVERYARALRTALPADLDVLAPEGPIGGHVWEQLTLPRRLRPGQLLISPANTGPLSVKYQVLAVHDLAFWHHPEWFSSGFSRWYRWLVPRLVQRVAHVITVSEFSRQDLVATFKLRADRVSVVPPFVEEMPGPDVDSGIGAPYCLVVASLDPRKGLDRAMAWYSSLGNPGFKLVIVGRGGPVFKPVSLPGNASIIHLRDVNDARLAALYRGAIALVQPSLFEGFGLPILEAMHHGCPVIAKDLPVFRENFGTAFIPAEIGPTPSMSKAIEEVVDPVRRQVRIQLGRTAAATFNLQRTRDALQRVLAPLLDR